MARTNGRKEYLKAFLESCFPAKWLKSKVENFRKFVKYLLQYITIKIFYF